MRNEPVEVSTGKKKKKKKKRWKKQRKKGEARYGDRVASH